MQELKHLHMVTKKDIVYPEAFPGGLKGLVKSVLDEYAKQFVEQPPVPEVAKGTFLVPSMGLLSMCICLAVQEKIRRLTCWRGP